MARSSASSAGHRPSAAKLSSSAPLGALATEFLLLGIDPCDQSELDKFNELANRWWDPEGPQRADLELEQAGTIHGYGIVFFFLTTLFGGMPAGTGSGVNNASGGSTSSVSPVPAGNMMLTLPL